MMNLTSEIEILTGFSLFVMMVFVVFFLLFSNGFYLKERKKEIGLISLMILLVGYYASANMDNMNLLINGLAAIVCVIVGTFLFYRSVMTMVFKALIKFKKVSYSKNRLVTLSSMMYRVGTNYKIYAAVSIFLTCTLTAYATSASFKFGLEDMNKVEFPFSIAYETEEKTDLYDDLLDYIKTNQGEITYSSNALPYFTITSVSYSNMSIDSTTEVVKYSDYKANLLPMDFKTESWILYEKGLENDQCLYIYPSEAVINIGEVDYLNIGGDQAIKIEAVKSIKAPVMGHKSDTIVVNDVTYEALKAYRIENPEGSYKNHYFTGIDIVNDAEFMAIHQEAMNEIAGMYGVTLDIKTNSNINNTDTLFVVIQLFYVFGLFLALAFVISTGSIIYFRIVSSASEDRNTYQLLYKMGLDMKVIKGMIHKQNLLFFLVPMIVAFVHSTFASMALERFMGISLLQPLLKSLLQSTLFIGVIFMMYYLITVQAYKKIVLDT